MIHPVFLKFQIATLWRCATYRPELTLPALNQLKKGNTQLSASDSTLPTTLMPSSNAPVLGWTARANLAPTNCAVRCGPPRCSSRIEEFDELCKIGERPCQ